MARGASRSCAACCSGSATRTTAASSIATSSPTTCSSRARTASAIVKILDFGIAKLYAGSPDDPASTRAGLTVGTPAYLSPEQAVGGEIKPASDLYSTTILLFEMITGRAPFEEKDPLAMLGAHVSRPPPRIAEVAPELDVPPALEDVIQRGLIKASAERITSAADYLAMLDGVLASAHGSAPRPVGMALGTANTALQLPAEPSGVAPIMVTTPAPGTLAPLTPLPGALPGPVHATPVGAQTTSLAAATRAISLADAAPIPRNWIKVGGIIVGVLILVAAILALASRSSGTIPATKGPSASPSGPAPSTSPARPSAPPPAKASAKTAPPPEAKPEATPPFMSNLVPEPLTDRETRFAALVDELQTAKTCEARKAAIPGLVELRDERAIAPLKKARYRMRGGVLGLGSSNANACLRRAAEAAIKALGGKLK